MKILIILLAVGHVLSQGCTDYYEHCSSYMTVCHDHSYRNVLHYCQKSCPNYCRTPPPPPPVLTGSCGIPQVQTSRVIAGENATAGAWPWQILLTFNGKAICGGSLIAPNWVVTAAHCVTKYLSYPSSFKVKVGKHDIKITESTEQVVGVKRIFQNPSYYNYLLRNDIALLKLDRSVMLNKYVSPICLPSQGETVAVGTECYITGWGKIRHPGRMHRILQQGKMPVVSNSVCNNLNHRTTGLSVTNAMVCGGYGPKSKVTGCHGDSGGPFVCQNKKTGSWTLHGAVSWGSKTCQTSMTYSVFARISEFRNWIDQTITDN